ncbi:hypothetical protein TcCL_Unassigned04498, partial [Trypanosoma cruzi]
MEREGEGRSTADTARESRQHEERAAGPAAQSTHHETASTQGGTQRQQPPTMQEEKTSTTISPSSFPQPQGNGKTPRPPHSAHGASEPSSIHHAATKFPAIPPSMGHGAQLSAVTRGASHPQENRLGLRTPSPPFSWPRRRQQPPHATA